MRKDFSFKKLHRDETTQPSGSTVDSRLADFDVVRGSNESRSCVGAAAPGGTRAPGSRTLGLSKLTYLISVIFLLINRLFRLD